MKPNVFFRRLNAALINTWASARCRWAPWLENCCNSLLKRGKPLKRLGSRSTWLHRAQAAVLIRTCRNAHEIFASNSFHHRWQTVEPHHPGGMADNSPAFQRWGNDQSASGPEGTAESAARGRGGNKCLNRPSV